MPEIFDTDITLSPSWLQVLDEEFKQSYFVSLCDFIRREKKSGKVIYPPQENIFNAFNSAPFESVKVVIIGQDPYHGAGQAHGLSFSVPSGVAIPPSLKNIYKELVDDCGVPMPECGNLKSWTEQGVLLLNATLTVEQGNAGAHQGQGWEKFTDSVISKLSEQREGLVFFLWGAFAQKKENLINAITFVSVPRFFG
jgi:uracil-DNA glycosylase